MVMEDIRVLEKHGGRSGDWLAPEATAAAGAASAAPSK
jgi:hypothetical protein